MKLSLGIVGLPNVGKSTLFNALTNNNIPAENYPFNTIDPNVGIVAVRDPRLDQLAKLIDPAKVTPAVVEFWDIAGLVKGAAQGEGLGNQFLANIRSVAAIVHVVRAFHNDNITHVEERIDPKGDIELINAELIMKDLETVESKISATGGRARADRTLQPFLDLLVELKQYLEQGKLSKEFINQVKDEELNNMLLELFLLTNKPVVFVVNTDSPEQDLSPELIEAMGDNSVVKMDIKLEAEIAELPLEDQAEYLQELGLNEPAIARLTREVYSLLGLISFFTAGEQEVRAWTITDGSRAPQAAGTIHTDFEKRFIKADIVPFDDFQTTGGWQPAKEQGKVKLAGKEYVMLDGDVALFKHNA